MMGKGRIPFLVLGGGIGGVAAALSLARRGRRVHVLEKATELAEIGAGLQLAPNAMRVLDWLEVLERIKSAAVFPQTLNLLDIVTAKRLKTVDLGTCLYRSVRLSLHRDASERSSQHSDPGVSRQWSRQL